MKQLAFVAIFGLSVLFALICSANAQCSKIACVDLQKIMLESDKGKEARQELAKELETKKRDLEGRKSDKTYQQLATLYQEQLKKRDQEFVQRILADLQEIIKSMSAEDGYGLIIEKKQGMLFADPAFPVKDISEEVIRRYNNFAKTQLPRQQRAQDNTIAATVVRNYLAAAGRQDASASKSFLSSNCKDDIVVEYQSNAQSGWNYSEQDTSVENEVKNADGRSATVKAHVVFKGGNPPTFMRTVKTFFLILENGEWKISGMDPKPRQVGLGVRPL
jgi:Skp family chaperone for outer membrane proteins